MDLALTLCTPRLLLRPFRAEDAPDLRRIAREPGILRWMPDWREATEDTPALIAFFRERFARSTGPENANALFAVTLDGALIGMVRTGRKEEVAGEVELAYFIEQARCRNGYGTEAAQAVCAWAFKALRLPYLIAIVEPENRPSQRVAEACGFQRLETRTILNAGEAEEKPFFYYRLAPPSTQ